MKRDLFVLVVVILIAGYRITNTREFREPMDWVEDDTRKWYDPEPGS